MREPSPRVWQTAVVVLIVVDVALVAMALRGSWGWGSTTNAVTRVAPSSVAYPSTSPSLSSSPTFIASSSPTPTPTSTTTPIASPSSTPSSSPTSTSPVPVRRLLVAVDDSRAWRASVGTCADGGASVSLTTDGGKTWTTRSAPAASIGRLVVRPGSDTVVAVGADTRCSLELRRTSDDGESWSDAVGLDGYFAVDPREPGSVAVPGQGTVRACGGNAVVDLAVRSGELRVLCADGRVRSIGDGDSDSSFADDVRVDGAVALSTSPIGAARTYVARVGQPECDGVQIVDTGRIGDPLSCVPGNRPAQPGSVSLSITGSAGWLLVGDTVYTSDDLTEWVER